MIRINVRPAIKVKVNFKNLIRGLILTTISLFIAYLAPYFYAETIRSETAELTKKNDEKKTQLNAMKEDLKRLATLRDQIEERNRRAQEIQNLNKGRKNPVFVLDKIQQIHFDKVWLETLSYNSRLVAISAIAKDPTIVSEYVAKLRYSFLDPSVQVSDFKEYEPSFLHPESASKRVEIVYPKVEFRSVRLIDSIDSGTLAGSQASLQKFKVEADLMEN